MPKNPYLFRVWNDDFIGNTALNGEGGLWVENGEIGSFEIRISNTTFEGNKANRGGGLGVVSNILTVCDDRSSVGNSVIAFHSGIFLLSYGYHRIWALLMETTLLF